MVIKYINSWYFFINADNRFYINQNTIVYTFLIFFMKYLMKIQGSYVLFVKLFLNAFLMFVFVW